MRYLIIGDANSMHIYNFIKTVLIPRGYEIYVMSLSIEKIKEEYMREYRNHNIVVSKVDYTVEKKNNLSKIQRMKLLIKKLNLITQLPHIDVCHIHSVYITSLIIFLLHRSCYDKLILSYWGSDILDTSKFTLFIREKCFRCADAITVTVKQLYDKFLQIHGERFKDKLTICRFATDGI